MNKNEWTRELNSVEIAVGVISTLVVFVVLFVCMSKKEMAPTSSETTATEATTASTVAASTDSKITEATPAPEDFVSVFAKVAGESIAQEANDILVNQIGFSEVEFVERIDETSNYEILADGIHVVITAMDGYYRVFMPNQSRIFYEDGQVLMTAVEYQDTIIDQDSKSAYYIIAKEIVSQQLKNPRSADFPSFTFSTQDISFTKTGTVITVQSYVDAKNSFGATVRSQWLVQFIPIDMDTYTYETTYININGDKSGTYTEIK